MPNPHQLVDHRGNPLRSARSASALREFRAKWDAAQTTVENSNHWANADGLSARAAASPEVRRKLRERARYERDNNTYCAGMVETWANDAIGTGPRLQLQTDDRGLNERISAEFEAWTASIGFAEKLRTYTEAKKVDGEGIMVMTANPRLPTAVKLDLRGVECDRLASPEASFGEDSLNDGIEFDRYGNPISYSIAKFHPGDAGGWGSWGEYERVEAVNVLHWFKRRRPEQTRGVPEITPALPLYALLRRYTLATVTAAEMAALFAVLLKTTMQPDEDTSAVLPFDTRDLVRGMITALPEGYEAQQMKPDHPATTYDMFEAAILRQIARCLNMPFNVAAGNSSGYNYASGRLDHQVYHRSIGVERYFLETHVLDRILMMWLAGARIASPNLVAGLEPGKLPRRRWGWDGFKHVDPSKEAAAAALRLANGTTTLDIECAEDGNDWREVARQRAEERRYFAELGEPYPGSPTPDAVAAMAEFALRDERDGRPAPRVNRPLHHLNGHGPGGRYRG